MGDFERFFGDGRYSEYVIENIIKSTLGPDDWLFDGGANEGRHTLAGLSTGASAIAVEPIPSLARRIRERASELGHRTDRIEVINSALSDRTGRAQFTYCPTRTTLSGLHSRERTKELPTELIDVEVMTIDQILSSRQSSTPKIIKLDLEGGEYNALKGASHTLTTHPVLIFEHGGSEGSRLYGYTYEEYWASLISAGYRIFTITGRCCAFEDFKTPLHWNYVALSEDVGFHRELARRFDYLTADAAQKMLSLHSVRTTV